MSSADLGTNQRHTRIHDAEVPAVESLFHSNVDNDDADSKSMRPVLRSSRL